MCQRFILSTPMEFLAARFGFLPSVPHPPRPNIRPTEPVAIVRLRPGAEGSGARELALVRWGLIPHWVKDPREFATVINARAETVADKPSFKAPLRHRRCIVPADGWYVWTGAPGRKSAYLIHPSTPGPLAFAALWDHWLGRDGSEIETMAILTRPVTPTLAAYDDRMPVLLDTAGVDAWLDVRGTPPAAALPWLADRGPYALAVNAVTSRLDDPTKDAPDLL